MTIVLDVVDLTKVFTTSRAESMVAVDRVSFQVRLGRCLAVVGESGSGKTTLARMLVGLERPSSGTVQMGELDCSLPPRNLTERRLRGRKLQIVFQDPYVSLDPRQTPERALEQILKLHTELDKVGRSVRIRDLADSVGLSTSQIRSRPATLSGGQRQRVAIARALAAEPDIIVLDEAVSALDVSIQAQILNLVDHLRRRQNLAFVFITHDLAVVRQVADDVLVMKQGAIVEQGTTAQVLDSPRNPYTRMLLASVPPSACPRSETDNTPSRRQT